VALENARLYDELKTLLRERERTQAQMIHSEKMNALGRLVASLAHEINNPLHAIESSVDLILDFPLDEQEQQQYLQAVRREIERLRTLTARVLDFARPPQIERQPISLAPAVRYALTLASKQLEHSHIETSLEMSDSLHPVLASHDHLVQVFLNLIINAIEAMPDGGNLTVSSQIVGGQVELIFADNGPGISPDALPIIFEPFYTTREQGTGLGLSVSYSIIQQHGGMITAGNSAGGGAVFTVALPLTLSSDLQQKEKE